MCRFGVPDVEGGSAEVWWTERPGREGSEGGIVVPSPGVVSFCCLQVGQCELLEGGFPPANRVEVGVGLGRSWRGSDIATTGNMAGAASVRRKTRVYGVTAAPVIEQSR